MATNQSTLRMGMVGGGAGSFIGDVHRKAATLDGGVELVCGVFGSIAARSRKFGTSLGLPRDRCYANHAEMIEAERARPETERIDFVSVVTPNHLHFPVSRDFLNAGFHVVCDKPMTLNVDEARELRTVVRRRKRVFCLTHNYTGYPMVKLARDTVRDGEIGTVHKVAVDYLQGWLQSERGRARLGTWRMDPKRGGAAGALGDIGSHAQNLMSYVTGLVPRDVCAELNVFTAKQKVDDDGVVLMRFDTGARGMLQFSRVATGKRNGLTLSVYGDRGALHWAQETPESLTIVGADGTERTLYRGAEETNRRSKAALAATRLPHGHPEGFIEAFANIYRNACDAMRSNRDGASLDADADADYPNVDDGLITMQFLEAVLANSSSKQKWTRVKGVPRERRS